MVSAYNHEKTLKKAVPNGSLGTLPAIPKRNPPRIRAGNAILSNGISAPFRIAAIAGLNQLSVRPESWTLVQFLKHFDRIVQDRSLTVDPNFKQKLAHLQT